MRKVWTNLEDPWVGYEYQKGDVSSAIGRPRSSENTRAINLRKRERLSITRNQWQAFSEQAKRAAWDVRRG